MLVLRWVAQNFQVGGRGEKQSNTAIKRLERAQNYHPPLHSFWHKTAAGSNTRFFFNPRRALKPTARPLSKSLDKITGCCFNRFILDEIESIRNIGDWKDAICLRLHGQNSDFPYVAISGMLDPKGHAFVLIQVLCKCVTLKFPSRKNRKFQVLRWQI